MTHTSGLTDHRPYYERLRSVPPAERAVELQRLLVDEPLVCKPGEAVCYSDIGFMILAWVVARIGGMPLSEFAEKNVFSPLGIDDLYYIRYKKTSAGQGVIAPTEHCPWRKKVICGRVHDDNAWVMDGEAAHAGLFGTARGVDRLLQALMDGYRNTGSEGLFSHATTRVFLSEWKGFRRTPGFDMPSVEGSSSGRYFSEKSVGHLGFTGTSFWMDPEQDIRIILLSNRIHPARDNIRIREFRPRIHDGVMESLGAVGFQKV